MGPGRALCLVCALAACSSADSRSDSRSDRPPGASSGPDPAAAPLSSGPAPAPPPAAGATAPPPAHGSGPRSSHLIDITSIDSSIRVDMRYATTRNFTGVALYPVARCLLRRDAAERLARAQHRLAVAGLGLLVWDCYRPFSVQVRLWKLVHDPRYVAEPVAAADSTPARGSRHNRGAAVDVTLVRADGSTVEMPTDLDDFSARAHRGSAAAPPAARRNAERLERALAAEGFEPLPTEWWHFDAPGWQRYPLSDEPLGPMRSAPAPHDAGAPSALP